MDLYQLFIHFGQPAIIALAIPAFLYMLHPSVHGNRPKITRDLIFMSVGAGVVLLVLFEAFAYRDYKEVAPVDAQLKSLLAQYPADVQDIGLAIDIRKGTVTCSRSTKHASEAQQTTSVILTGLVAQNPEGGEGMLTALRTDAGWTINNAYIHKVKTSLVTPSELTAMVQKCATAEVVPPTPQPRERTTKAWADSRPASGA